MSPLQRSTLAFVITLPFLVGPAPVRAQTDFNEIPEVVRTRVEKVAWQDDQTCGKCHTRELEAWQSTHHFSTFRAMPRSPDATEITQKLGVKDIRKSLCMTCHFTSQKVEDEISAVAGISCESCHGPAADWIDVHQDFGSDGDRKLEKHEEDPAHAKQRIAKSVAAGMIRPENIDAVARNCFQCHTVPNERLVNEGGHNVGSLDFDLVAWSQGEVRHNFTDPKVNRPASKERQRILFVVGRALDLEYSYRGTAAATEKATYGVTLARRAVAALKKVEEIQQFAPLSEISEMIAAAKSAKLKLNNEAELLAAADGIAAATKKFTQNHDGSQLAALDPLLPDPGQYKGSAIE